MLGVLLNELSSGHRQTTTTTTYVDTYAPAPYVAKEILLSAEGLCYSVSYQGATKVLTQIPTYECR